MNTWWINSLLKLVNENMNFHLTLVRICIMIFFQVENKNVHMCTVLGYETSPFEGEMPLY